MVTFVTSDFLFGWRIKTVIVTAQKLSWDNIRWFTFTQKQQVTSISHVGIQPSDSSQIC